MPNCSKCGKPLDCKCPNCGASAPVDEVVQECPLKKGAIWALIKDDTGKGVVNVQFTGPGTKKSDDVGFASFDPLSEKTYDVTATVPLPDEIKDDFHLPAPTTKQVPVKTGQITQVVFQLKRRPSRPSLRMLRRSSS